MRTRKITRTGSCVLNPTPRSQTTKPAGIPSRRVGGHNHSIATLPDKQGQAQQGGHDQGSRLSSHANHRPSSRRFLRHFPRVEPGSPFVGWKNKKPTPPAVAAMASSWWRGDVGGGAITAILQTRQTAVKKKKIREKKCANLVDKSRSPEKKPGRLAAGLPFFPGERRPNGLQSDSVHPFTDRWGKTCWLVDAGTRAGRVREFFFF